MEQKKLAGQWYELKEEIIPKFRLSCKFQGELLEENLEDRAFTGKDL